MAQATASTSTLYILFLMPGALALIFYGYAFAADSWFYKEVSWSQPGSRIQIYFFKTLIPVSGVLILLLQGFAEIGALRDSVPEDRHLAGASPATCRRPRPC